MQTKAKTARGKRILISKEPKLVEPAKQALFIKGTKTSEDINFVLKDLVSHFT